jgi:hypothetical protein
MQQAYVGLWGAGTPGVILEFCLHQIVQEEHLKNAVFTPVLTQLHMA